MPLSLFQKRHYDFLVPLLQQTTDKAIVIKLSEAFMQDNPKFSHDRFIKAIYRSSDD